MGEDRATGFAKENPNGPENQGLSLAVQHPVISTVPTKWPHVNFTRLAIVVMLLMVVLRSSPASVRISCKSLRSVC